MRIREKWTKEDKGRKQKKQGRVKTHSNTDPLEICSLNACLQARTFHFFYCDRGLCTFFTFVFLFHLVMCFGGKEGWKGLKM